MRFTAGVAWLALVARNSKLQAQPLFDRFLDQCNLRGMQFPNLMQQARSGNGDQPLCIERPGLEERFGNCDLETRAVYAGRMRHQRDHDAVLRLRLDTQVPGMV